MRCDRITNHRRHIGSVGRVISCVLLMALISACATTQPIKSDIPTVLADPETYHKKRVELSGMVLDYEPARGDTYRTLQFTLGVGPNEKIPVFCSGYTADAIAKASDLAGEAFRARKPVIVVGILRTDEVAPAELKLESIEYGDRIIDVTRGRKTRPGFDAGGFRIVPSIGIGVVIGH